MRFEGQSDPDDEVILFALSEPGGRKGVYSAQYGPSMPPEDAAVIAKLRPPPAEPPRVRRRFAAPWTGDLAAGLDG